MNAVEIEQAVSALAEQAFDAAEFPFAFLQAFGNRETTIRKLRTAASNKSDLGGVLQAKHIHIAVCPPGETAKTPAALRESPATATAKARFILATDGTYVEAEDRDTGETAACDYNDLPNHFGCPGNASCQQGRHTGIGGSCASNARDVHRQELDNNRSTHIVLAREAHFPATIADLYDPDTMPANLREAHEHNDEVLERIYIGRRFRNDTERLEKLFELYTKMTAAAVPRRVGEGGRGVSS